MHKLFCGRIISRMGVGRMKLLALFLSAGMFAFSAWMFLETGDWVALVFAGGSLAYGLFFASGMMGRGR